MYWSRMLTTATNGNCVHHCWEWKDSRYRSQTPRPVSSEALLHAGATVADGLCTGQKPAVTSACNTGSCVCPARQSICSTYACSANFCQSKGYLGGEYCAYTYYTPFWGATTVATNTIGSAQPNQCCANQVVLVDMSCAVCDVTIMHVSNTEQHCTALIEVEDASVASAGLTVINYTVRSELNTQASDSCAAAHE